MPRRREIDLRVAHGRSGIDCRVTRKGLEIDGWYDSFVGIEGRLIPWDELDDARKYVMSSEPLEELS